MRWPMRFPNHKKRYIFLVLYIYYSSQFDIIYFLYFFYTNVKHIYKLVMDRKNNESNTKTSGKGA